MPLPAGTGLTRRDVRLAHGRARARGLRRRRAQLVRVRRRDRARRVRGGRDEQGARLGLPRRRDRRALRALPGRRPDVLLAAPEPRARADDRDARTPRTAACAGIPPTASIATLHGEGKVSVIPAIGYANSDQSHFTSRHYWEVGATDATLRTGWLGRYLDKIGTRRQPAAGALARRRAPAGARDRRRCRSRRSRRPTSTRSRRPASPPHPLESSILQEAANIGAVHAKSPDAGLSTAGSIALSLAPPRERARRVRVRLQEPGCLPGVDRSRSRTGSPGSRR